ncbi:Quinol monooxygenase YgiN [Sanguibacter gelidistatuariae]|uniref:Quinol monooxygenase YgiN n=1 Tax=Sanguibacter gelidistatuariae TaxID=1814289 RepID=A0A1G6H6B0_9MICO|nr:putative quinol monooxygenase [Sanguibacter gelidistatuariae]SDB89714.1 Quinol monooxygenase YgiN [Sanguibacter gelidistatuariae]
MTIDVPTTAGPVVLIGTARPLPGREEALRSLLLSFAEPTRAEPGSVQYLLHTDPAGNFVFYEHWRSAADLQAHLDLPHMQDFLARRGTYLDGDLDITWLTLH